MPISQGPPFLRDRHGHAHVTNEELFFDLLYAFAITQLSHRLLEHLTLANALQTLVLWFAVWLGWQYTAWVTNWFNPENRSMRVMLFGVMLLGLLMSSAIPDAFGERGLMFAACFAAIQVGRKTRRPSSPSSSLSPAAWRCGGSTSTPPANTAPQRSSTPTTRAASARTFTTSTSR